MPLAYIALGSNLGDRLGQMQNALEQLQSRFALRVLRVSPVYENRAVGMGADAGDFLNAVVEISTALQALELLDVCMEVETQLGRTRSDAGWVPRTIDLDLLHYEGVIMQDEKLILPHPRITERDFVAVPLADLAPDLEIYDRAVSAIVKDLPVIELKLVEHKLLTPEREHHKRL
ncbi:MAG: 2-amino-4-hydroxy-6-hydroxymethyldihydropteridine diphosphokinase [Opitutales bacterium]